MKPEKDMWPCLLLTHRNNDDVIAFCLNSGDSIPNSNNKNSLDKPVIFEFGQYEK